MLPKELTKEEIVDKYKSYLTVGDLKKHLEKYNIPDDAKVLVQRVEDIYYENNNWSSYYKIGEQARHALQWNEDIKSGKYLNKEKYPSMKEENLIPNTEKEIKENMDQYHPVWSCVRYQNDHDLLFLDLHY